VFICTLTHLVLRLMGRHASLSPENKRNGLAMQMAFTLLLVAAATIYWPNRFYPAFRIALGTHYLQLALLYGMRHFAALAAVLIGGGLVLGLYPRIRLSSADGFQEQS